MRMNMTDVKKDNEVTEARKQLLGKIRDVRYGRIENLDIKDGQPHFTASTKTVRDIILDSDDEVPGKPSWSGDFLRKKHVVKMFRCFDKTVDGKVDITIRDGLPTKLQVIN